VWHVIKPTELVGHSLIQFLFSTHNCYTLHMHLAQFIIIYMCSPVLMSRLCYILVVFGLDILHAIANLNRASHCIAADSEYFEVFVVSIVVMLWAIGRASKLHYFPNYLFFFESLSWITFRCCSHNLHRPERTKQRVERTTHGITAVEIPRSTKSTLLQLLRIQRYMWRNHIGTWTFANTVAGIWI